MIKKILSFFGLLPQKRNSKEINLDSLVNCIGYSAHSKEFKNAVKDLNCSKLEGYREITNKENTFRISFHYKSDHLNRIGNPKGLTTSKDEEPIVYYVKFDDLFEYEKRTPNIKLPYSLKANDSKEEVHRKIGLKPYDKQKIHLSEMIEGSLDYFDCPNFQIQAWYDEKNCLFELMFSKITLEERSKMEFDKTIRTQRKNINPNFSEKIKLLKNEIPDLTFGDVTKKEFARKIVKELSVFVENCVQYTKSKNPKAIINSVKKVVEKINDINYQENGLIETIQREAICSFTHPQGSPAHDGIIQTKLT
jgi:hypothetical protein